MSKADPRTALTREKLLDAAGEVFAEKGFRGATIEAISRRAGANLAAVNYHFGDKEGLYRAVIDHAHGLAVSLFPPEPGPDVPADEKLRGHIAATLRHLLVDGGPAWHGRLMAREMFEPTGALDAFVRDFIHPNFTRLQGIVREILEGGSKGQASDEEVRRCAFSVIAQCVFYRHSRPVIDRLFPGLPFDEAKVAALSAHIAAFSLAGVKAVQDASPAKAAQAEPAKSARRTSEAAPRPGSEKPISAVRAPRRGAKGGA
jgi:AcrR family transcriptional regulator